VHIGTINTGHYVAYTKRFESWYLFDDERYYPVKAKEALD